jgi:lactate dehydrogenase-like 2-hydroxyacid dehydrogenase
MKYKTLFLTNRGQIHQNVALEAAPPELDVIMRRGASKDEVIALLPEMEFLISERTGVIDTDIIAAGRKLRLIQRLGSQTWDIDIDAAGRAKIPVCYLPVRTCVLVAEHLLLQMLAVAKRIRELVDITDKAGDWGSKPQRCNENYFAFNWSGRKRSTAFIKAQSASWVSARSVPSSRAACKALVVECFIRSGIGCRKRWRPISD